MSLADAHRLWYGWRFGAWLAELRRQKQAAALEREMRRQGILDRCRDVDAAIRTPEFGQRFNAAFDATKNDPERACRGEDDVRALAFAVLAEMGIDTTDVHTVVFLHADGRIRFGPEVTGAPVASPTIASRTRCLAALGMGDA